MDEKDRFDNGMQTRRAVLGEDYVEKAAGSTTPFNAEMQDLITRYAWGELWSRPGLSRSTRSLLTIAMLIALHHWDELRMHLRAARNAGVTQEELKEALLHSAVYCGIPAANHAFRIALEVLRETGTVPRQ
jgi:4-carboxymuconolactone decarboxylase